MPMTLADEKETLRQKVVDAARHHKASWIQLGQYLYTVHKDKLFKAWGHLTFEAYCVKELGIRQTTAAKLLKSYSFLEREEPSLIEKGRDEKPADPKSIPSYESVNLLRLARDNKSLTPQDFSDIRHAVIDSCKEPKEVKAKMKQILEERKEVEPAEVRRERRNAQIKRTIAALKSAIRELEADHLLPDYLLKQMTALIDKLQDQIEA